MRVLIIVLAALSYSCSALDPALQNAISYGEITELNKYTPNIDKKLLVRLFQSPIYKEDCFQETHGVCQYKYYLSVSTFDEYPETNVYSLAILGEIEKITWERSADIDTANLEIIVSRYTKDALLNNNELINSRTKIRLAVTPKRIEQSVFNLAGVE